MLFPVIPLFPLLLPPIVKWSSINENFLLNDAGNLSGRARLASGRRFIGGRAPLAHLKSFAQVMVNLGRTEGARAGRLDMPQCFTFARWLFGFPVVVFFTDHHPNDDAWPSFCGASGAFCSGLPARHRACPQEEIICCPHAARRRMTATHAIAPDVTRRQFFLFVPVFAGDDNRGCQEARTRVTWRVKSPTSLV